LADDIRGNTGGLSEQTGKKRKEKREGRSPRETRRRSLKKGLGGVKCPVQGAFAVKPSISSSWYMSKSSPAASSCKGEARKDTYLHQPNAKAWGIKKKVSCRRGGKAGVKVVEGMAGEDQLRESEIHEKSVSDALTGKEEEGSDTCIGNVSIGEAA